LALTQVAGRRQAQIRVQHLGQLRRRGQVDLVAQQLQSAPVDGGDAQEHLLLVRQQAARLGHNAQGLHLCEDAHDLGEEGVREVLA
jgi:hypothetical protein